MSTLNRRIGLCVLILVALAGCGLLPASRPELPPTAVETIPRRATPMADTPAAGICPEAEGEVVTMTIRPDIPDPRCVVVSPGQHLRVVNERGETITAALYTESVELEPGSAYRFAASFGELLLPGVHVLQVSPCCGGSLWLRSP